MAYPINHLRQSGLLLFFSVLSALLLFYIFFSYGVPSVEEHILLNRMHLLKFHELFTSTLSNAWNLYDSPLTSRTDIYRPIYELTFMLDKWISGFLGIDFFKISNILYFVISVFIFSLFVKQHIGLKYAVLAIFLYSIHSGHVHSQYSYANRLGVLVSIYVFSIIYVYYQLLKGKSIFKVFLLYLLSILFIFTKETGVIIFLFPAFSFFLYVYLHKLEIKSQFIIHWRHLALHTFLLFVLVLIYLYIRTLLFEGIGNYHPNNSFFGIILNIGFACQYIIGFKIRYAVFALPVIIFLGYVFYNSKNKLLLVIIFLLIVGIYGPSLIYTIGKRYSCPSAMFFIFFFLYFLKDVRHLYLKWGLLASFAIPMAVQAIDIKMKQLSAFKVRADIEKQLEILKLSSDTIAVVMPMYVNDESILLRSGIPEYLYTLQNFRKKKVIVLGAIHDSNRYYSLGITKRAYSPIVTKNNSKVIVNYPPDGRFDVPHLPKEYTEFDNKYFHYQNQIEKHEATFDVKVKNFQVIYFEKLDYDKFVFKII